MNRVYYRGMIDFCNYRCSYCPFAKRTARAECLDRERELLGKLRTELQTIDEVGLMITPYGEALIHDFYQEAIAEIASLPNVRKVGVQTNLSFDAEAFLRRIEGVQDKVVLWATCHTECTSTEAFAKKVHTLQPEIELSVGMVATGENEEDLRRLRSQLPPTVYLWLNGMDRRRRIFSDETIDRLRTIDPMFGTEFARRREAVRQENRGFLRCHSSECRYVDAGIVSNRCFFQKKRAVPEDCDDHRICDCYLGYSNFDEPAMNFFFGEGLAFRVPERRTFRALFLDLDGVLTDADGRPKSGLTETLELLRMKMKLYLATARSVDGARRALRGRMSLFSGGVFSDGAELVEWEEGGRRLFPIERSFDGTVLWEDRTTDGILLRQRIAPHDAEKTFPEGLELRRYRDRYYLRSAGASKRNGIAELLRRHGWREDEVFFLSDNPEDADVFRALPYTGAPVGAEKASNLALCSLNLNHLAYLLQ